MALDKVLIIYDEQGNPVDYDILAKDVKFQPDGKDLPTKLAEMEQEIEDAAGGGYAPPAGGIPKSDLASGVQSSLDKADTALQQSDKTELQNEIDNKVDAVNGKGLSTNDFTDALLAKLNSLDPYTKAQVDALIAAASSGAVSVTTNQDGTFTITVGNDTYVFDDFPTKQDMADAIDDALGEAQVTVVPEGSVGVISSLGSDSDEDALSASMGKKLKVAIITILSNLGEYAFPNGKPTIDWGGSGSVTFSVTYPDASVTKVTHGSAPDSVNLGDQLEVTLGTNDDLYVIKDSSVKVFMGGVEQSGAYNASTQKVTLAAVTGAVVIVAESMTYVGYGQQSSPLALMLDCKNRGGQSGHWIDLIGSKDFALTDVTEADSGMVFNGSSSKGVASGNVPVLASAGTIESVFTIADSATDPNMIFMNPYTQGIALAERFDDNQSYIFNFIANNGNSQSINGAYNNGGHNLVNAVSVSNTRGFNNGVAQTDYPDQTWLVYDTTSVLAVGYRKRSSGENFFNGTIKSIRIYSRALSEAEVLQNYEVDKKRFNLA